MRKILTASQMREIDRLTTEQAYVASLVLMENAGFQLWSALRERFPDLDRRRIAVLCGKGNNGGDGMVLARQLHQHGSTPDVYLFGRAEELHGDAATNYRALRAHGLSVHEIPGESDRQDVASRLEAYDVLVDALLGTGLTKPLGGLYARVVEAMNHSRAFVLAVDIPSGMPSDQIEPPPLCVRADVTVTFTAPKIAHALNRNRKSFGEIKVAAIGTPKSLMERPDLQLHWLEPADVLNWYPGRPASSHKGTYGHVAVVAGSLGKAGAAGLASCAALRAGSGLVTVFCPGRVQDCIAGFHPEIMTEGFPSTDQGSFDDGGTAPVVEGLARLDAAALGPGLTTHPRTLRFVHRVVEESPVPLVIDADGLNAFAGAAHQLRNRVQKPLVLTPHPGEFVRLTGRPIEEILADGPALARAFAVERRVWLVLKDFRCIVADPEGRVFVSPFGNPGMATAGMGDVLTGVLVSMLGRENLRNLPDAEFVTGAVCTGVLLHGRAGDRAAARCGEEALAAGDVITELGDAWRDFVRVGGP